jgi:hypothetical protein
VSAPTDLSNSRDRRACLVCSFLHSLEISYLGEMIGVMAILTT